MSAPFLTTDRLELWMPVKEDIPRMYAVVADVHTSRHFGAVPTESDHFTRFQRNAGSWYLNGYGGLMVRLRGRDEVIGNCGVFHSHRGLGADFDDSPEGGWIIAHEHVGKGLGREAMEAVFAWFDREHGPLRTVCMIAPANEPSLRLAARLGFTAMRDAEFAGEAIRLLERQP